MERLLLSPQGQVVLLICGGLLLALFIAIVIVSWLTAGRRTRALAALAAELDLDFFEQDAFDMPKRFSHLVTINRGDSRKASNVLRGDHQGRNTTAFDCTYTTGSGKDGTISSFSGLAVACGCRLPGLVILPEDIFDKVAGALGEFESHEFSSKFRVQSSDRQFAYAVVTPQMMEHLLANQGWCIELGGSEAVITSGETWKPEDFKKAMAVLGGFLDRIPRFVWKDLGESREAARSSPAASRS